MTTGDLLKQNRHFGMSKWRLNYKTNPPTPFKKGGKEEIILRNLLLWFL